MKDLKGVSKYQLRISTPRATLVFSGLSRPYPLKFFKDCLPQNLLHPFLNTLSQILLEVLQILRGVEIWEEELAGHSESQNLIKIIFDLSSLLIHKYISKYLTKATF